MKKLIRRDRDLPEKGMRSAWVSLGVALLACVGPGCFGSSTSEPVADEAMRALLQAVARAQVETDYQGQRRRIQRDRDQDQQTSHFVERVFHCSARSDGTPERHLVELVVVEDESAQPTVWAEGQFEQLSLNHRVRSNFIERYRELRIVDAELLLQNYVVTKIPAEPVLERPCVLLEIKPRNETHELGLGRGQYQLWIDEKTHLPLKTREFAVESGQTKLVGESEFLSLEALGDPAGITWPALEFERSPIEDGVLPEFLASRNVGFPPSVAGFKKVRREAVRAPSMGSFLLHFESDGLEPLLYLQGLPELPARLEVRGTDRGQDLVELEILEVEFGRTIALTSTYDGVSTYLIGKGRRSEMRRLFQQLFRF